MNAAARIVPGTPGWPSPGATGPFTTDRDWLPFHPDPSRPLFRPPPGAVDAQTPLSVSEGIGLGMLIVPHMAGYDPKDPCTVDLPVPD